MDKISQRVLGWKQQLAYELFHHNQGLINHLDCTFFYTPRGNWTHFCINIHVFLGMFSIYEWNTMLKRFAVRVDVLFCNYSGKSLGDFCCILLYCSDHGLNPVEFLSVPLEWSQIDDSLTGAGKFHQCPVKDMLYWRGHNRLSDRSD